MRHRRNTGGFTLMEMLIAVGVMVVLMGVAFIGVINYQKSTKQVELDKTARELFIAAQNHLTVAQGQGLLKDAKGAELGVQPGDSASTDVYCFFVGPGAISSVQNTMLNAMLPLYSIDETVRTGGSYAIQYDAKSGTVLNVFYSDQSNLSKHTFVEDDYNNLFDACVGEEQGQKDARLDFDGTIIGWYGGQDLGNRTPQELMAPQLKVINAERLLVEVSISNLSPEGVTKPRLQIIMRGEKSGESVLVDDVEFTTLRLDPKVTVTGSGGTKQYVLDDITESEKHFANQFASFIPGENITLQAKVYSNDTLSTIAQSERRHTNSLFADVITDESQKPTGAQALDPNAAKGVQVAEIANIRHLENLDAAISGYDLESLGDAGATHAKQVSDLRWAGADDGFTEKIAGSGGTANEVRVYPLSGNATAKGTYAPVNPTSNDTSYKLNYDGDGYKVAGIKVQNAADAGMFGSVTEGEIKNLKLSDFSVATTGGNAGALAGTLKNTKVEGVYAYNEAADDDGSKEVSASANAGGLVGSLEGNSIFSSSASVYVKSTGTSDASAGGLVGSMTGDALIDKCYSGGHTVNGKYLNEAPSSESESKVGRINVQGQAEVGGLVGKVASSHNKPITNSYSTCSTYGATVGGLVGSAAGGTIQNCYATGLVLGSGESASIGAFAGTASGTTFDGDQYLMITNDGANPALKPTSTWTDNDKGIAAADDDNGNTKALQNYRNFYSKLFSADPALTDNTRKQNAAPYDDTLAMNYNGQYPFKSVNELDNASFNAESIHYGDWPSYETLAVNIKK